MESSNLNFFYGKECPHCDKMLRLLKEFETETGKKINKFEVWHDKENMKTMEAIDRDECGGVPYFFNQTTNKNICGEATMDEIKEWAG